MPDFQFGVLVVVCLEWFLVIQNMWVFVLYFLDFVPGSLLSGLSCAQGMDYVI